MLAESSELDRAARLNMALRERMRAIVSKQVFGYLSLGRRVIFIKRILGLIDGVLSVLQLPCQKNVGKSIAEGAE